MPAVRSRIRRPAPVSDSLQKLGDRIRQARLDAGLSQAELGTPHFTRAYVSAIELGKVRPAMKSLEFLADKLGKSVSFFVADEAGDRRRLERELEVSTAMALLSRPTAGEALRLIEDLIESATSPAELRQLHLLAGTALNFLTRGADALKHLVSAERGDAGLESARKVKYQMAIAYRLTMNLGRATELLQQVLKDLESSPIPDQLFRMKVLKDLGAVAMDSGDYETANGYFIVAMEWARDIGDVSGLISIYNGLAYSYRAMGDLDAAATYLHRAVGATDVVHDLTSAVVMHNGLAVIAAERGHVQSAYRHADRAIQIARATGPTSYVPHCLNTKAECASKIGDWAVASEAAQEALLLAQAAGNDRAAAAARLVLSNVAARNGDLSVAETELRDAATLYETAGAKAELGEALMRMSKLVGEQGRTKEAQNYATLAYEATKKSTTLVGG
ncbi:MAG: hypothetical protein NVS9B6_06160 [Candidatus Limnocylindrales bacterium]